MNDPTKETGMATKKVNIFHHDFFNSALRYGEVEGLSCFTDDDGEIKLAYDDDLTQEDLVNKLLNGLTLAYTKGAIVGQRE